MANKDYYTVAEVADLANMSTSYINNLITSGKLKAMKEPAHGHGGFKYQIDSKEVDRLLESKNGAIEAAKEPHSNVFVDMAQLQKLTGLNYSQIKDDEKIGRITPVWVSVPGKRGRRQGYSVKEVKRYMKILKENIPQFITAEEMEELIK